jgi:hypothetical protein
LSIAASGVIPLFITSFIALANTCSVCPRCGGRQADMVVTGTKRWYASGSTLTRGTRSRCRLGVGERSFAATHNLIDCFGRMRSGKPYSAQRPSPIFWT